MTDVQPQPAEGFFARNRVKFGVTAILGVPLLASGAIFYLLSKDPKPVVVPPPPPPVVVETKKQDRVIPAPDVDDTTFPDIAILDPPDTLLPFPQIEPPGNTPVSHEQQLMQAVNKLQSEINKLRSDVAAIRTDRAHLVAQIEQLKVALAGGRAKVSQSRVQESSVTAQIESLKKQLLKLQNSTVRHDLGD